MNQTFQDILFDAIARYGVPLVIFIFSTVVGWILTKIGVPIAKELWVQAAMKRVASELKDAVLAINQTYVDKMRLARDDGIITAEERAEARRAALNEAKIQLGKRFLDRLSRVLGFDEAGMDRMLGNKLEAQVARVNLIRSGAVYPVSVDGSTTPVPVAVSPRPLPPPPSGKSER